LQKQIAVARAVCTNPVVESDRHIIVDDAEEFLREMHHVAFDRRIFDGRICQEAADAARHQTPFKGRVVPNSRGKARDNSFKIIGQQITAVSFIPQADQRMLCHHGVEQTEQVTYGPPICLPRNRNTGVKTSGHKSVFELPSQLRPP
jgi:hypothetical protein